MANLEETIEIIQKWDELFTKRRKKETGQIINLTNKEQVDILNDFKNCLYKKTTSKKVKAEEIIRHCCKILGVDYQNIMLVKRDSSKTSPRLIITIMLIEFTYLTNEEIGKVLNNTPRSTIQSRIKRDAIYSSNNESYIKKKKQVEKYLIGVI